MESFAQATSSKTVFKCRLDSVDTLFFAGEAVRVSLPTLAGDVTILPLHAPLIAPLRPGFVRFVLPEIHNSCAFYVSSGFAQVDGGELRILAREATPFHEGELSPFPDEFLVFEEV